MYVYIKNEGGTVNTLVEFSFKVERARLASARVQPGLPYPRTR